MGDSVLAAHLCVECKLDLNVFSFMLIGVFLESRVTSVKVSRTYFSLSAFYHSCLNTPVFVMSPPLTCCLVFFFFFFSVYLCGAQTMPPAGRHCLSTHEENSKRTGNDTLIHSNQHVYF